MQRFQLLSTLWTQAYVWDLRVCGWMRACVCVLTVSVIIGKKSTEPYRMTPVMERIYGGKWMSGYECVLFEPTALHVSLHSSIPVPFIDAFQCIHDHE